MRTDIGDEDDPDTPRGESQYKREVSALQDPDTALGASPKGKLVKMSLPGKLIDVLHEAKRTTVHEGRHRQTQYIGKPMHVLANKEVKTIRRVLATFAGASEAGTTRLRAIERWHDRLIASDDAIIELTTAHPDVGVQALRILVRNVRKEMQLAKPPKSSREPLQMIKQALSDRDRNEDDADRFEAEDDKV